MNRSKTLKILGNVLYGIIIAAIIFTTITIIATRASGGQPQLFGYQIKTVLSGSMEPTFKTGSIIVVKKLENPKSLKVGDVITFKYNPETLVTHRIAKVVKNDSGVHYFTKGDNNKAADGDPVFYKNVVAKYTGITIPYFGYMLTYISKPIGTAILLIIPGLFLLVYSVICFRQALREIEANTKNSSTSEGKTT